MEEEKKISEQKIVEQKIYDQFSTDQNQWDDADSSWDDSTEIVYTRETKSTLFTAGEYVVLANSKPYRGVQKITGVNEVFQDAGSGTIVKKEFRYSIDSVSFSEFQELNQTNLSDIGPFNAVWFQFRYILLSGGPITYTKTDIIFEPIQTDKYSGYVQPNIQDESRVYAFPVTYKSNFLWNPYKLNRAIRLYKDLNLMVNNLFGHQTNYYRALPQGRSKDVVLMEYSLYEHDDAKCVKVVVPNNEFPDNKLNMGPFGVDFEMPFEVHIDKDYFQTIFGSGSGPQKRDVLYFPITGRIYEVSSSYLFRDFMNEPLYFKVTLIKWLPKSNAEQSETLNALESYTNSAGELFGELINDDILNKTKPEQYKVAYANDDDLVRSYISSAQQINEIQLLNYDLVVAKYCYELPSILKPSMIRVKIDAQFLNKNQTYYVRFDPGSSQPDYQYFYSIKILQYLGQDYEGYSVFSYTGGKSQVQNLYLINEIFVENSPFNIYEKEYAGETADEVLVSCKTASMQNYTDDNVIYKENGCFPKEEDRSFSAWFNLESNPNPTTSIVSQNYDQYSREMTIRMSKEVYFAIGDRVSLTRTSGGDFNICGTVVQIISRDSIVVEFEEAFVNYVKTTYGTWYTYTDLLVQKTLSRVFLTSLLNGKGIQIELIENRHFKVTSNTDTYYFSIPTNTPPLELNKWYAVFINFSNLFKQLTLNIWSLQWNEKTNMPATTDLKLIYNRTVSLQKVERTSDLAYRLKPSFMKITNLRLFNKVAETDKQVFILNQNIVKDSQWVLISDNALPQDRRPYISYTR